jgi:hypothetical protein
MVIQPNFYNVMAPRKKKILDNQTIVSTSTVSRKNFESVPLKNIVPLLSPKKPTDASGLPAGLARPAIRALHGAGYTTLEQLSHIRRQEIAALHGIGPTAYRDRYDQTGAHR